MKCQFSDNSYPPPILPRCNFETLGLDSLSIADLIALKSFFLEIIANDKQVKNGVADDRKEFLENEIERLEFLADQIESEMWARIEPLENWAEKVLKSKKA